MGNSEAVQLGFVDERLHQINQTVYDVVLAIGAGNEIADRAQKVAEFHALTLDGNAIGGYRAGSAASLRRKTLAAELWPDV